jgi:hypothetical protein
LPEIAVGSALPLTKSRRPQPLIFFAKFGFDFFTVEIATGAVFLDSADGACYFEEDRGFRRLMANCASRTGSHG